MPPFLITTVVLSVALIRVPAELHQDGYDAHMRRVRAKGWTMGPPAPAETKLELIVAVKQSLRGVALLEQELYRVSDPSSEAYGEHLSNQQVHSMVAPSFESTDAVGAWLRAHGITLTNSTRNGDFVGATITVEVAERLLATRYHLFTHTSGARVVRASSPYTLPVAVAGHVDFVAPTMTFPPLHRRMSPRPSAPVSGDEASNRFKVTPAFLRQLYGLNASDVGRGSASNNSMAVASFLKQYYSQSTAFRAKYTPPATSPVADVPASQQHSPVGTEAALDTQYLPALGAGVSMQVWSTEGEQPGNPGSEPFIKWLTAVAATDDAPKLFSISYGDEEDGVSRSYAERCNVEFQKAGARGISLLCASGDAGAGCAVGEFVPTFPASSPWVTAVGGLTGGGAPAQVRGTTGETTAALSGGGFSNYFARPAFQESAAAKYLKQSGLPKASMFNASGAGFPDISAQALQFDTCTDGFFYPVDGTSAACPTAAGIFATLNQARADAALPPLGYLNPLIYQNPDAFNDVTEGYNNYCDNPSAFPATSGWDAATGVGSPNYPKLKALALRLGQ
jgi:tripeptidyl-peptidase-1